MRYVTEAQIEFGRRLGLDFTGKSQGEALAMNYDVVHCDFLGSRMANQILIAGALGLVGFAISPLFPSLIDHSAINCKNAAVSFRLSFN